MAQTNSQTNPQLGKPTADVAALQATIEALRAANSKLAADNVKLTVAVAAPRVTLKVSEKGGVSLYGLGRFPVTLYHDQWIRVLGMADQIREFLTANKDKLHEKAAKG